MSDSITVTVSVEGLNAMARLFGATAKQLETAKRSALNRTATRVRREMTDEMTAATGIKRKLLNQRLAIRSARRGEDAVRIVPSSASVPVSAYRYRAESVDDTGTRARIWVDWPGGRKLAAGFINPRGLKKAPLRTRSHKGPLPRPRSALGPSVAALFRVIVTTAKRARYAEILREQLDLAVRRVMRT